jgi:hypothetical protein
MPSRAALLLALCVPAGVLAAPPPDSATLMNEARCQRRIASQGARFAQRVVKANLKCATAVADCQIQCEAGVYGPSCDTNPPPCCDPDDPSSSQGFGDCMTTAQDTCDQQTTNIARWEIDKQTSITTACAPLTQEELCGANAEGLNFATLNAGCSAVIPGYACNLANLVACVGGPLEHQLLGEISATLNPRLPDAVATFPAVLQAKFPGVPITRRAIKETLPAGQADIWQISGQAGDQVIVRVKTRDDTGTSVSTLDPVATLFDGSLNPVPNVTVVGTQCPVGSACGLAGCPLLKRSLPDDGAFDIVVRAASTAGCGGGGYRLVVTSPSGSIPQLIADDVTPPPGS